jgi:protein-disulfide isomerase
MPVVVTAGAALLLALAPSLDARAQVPGCATLPPGGTALVRELFAALHPYDGCDETLEKCLAASPPAPVVTRMAADICRMVKAGKDRREVERAFDRRARSMTATGAPAAIALDEATRAGDPGAPVVVVVYACARCPFCAVIVPALHREVTAGALKGRARLYFRPFPIKDHAGAVEGGLAMVAAAQLGGFWAFLTGMYGRYDQFCPKLLPEWAAAAGMDRAAFEKACADPRTREQLVASKQEGVRNRVAATPTIFINGKRYVYDLEAATIADVIAEEHERVRSAAAKR